jgi:hypothetical protein
MTLDSTACTPAPSTVQLTLSARRLLASAGPLFALLTGQRMPPAATLLGLAVRCVRRRLDAGALPLLQAGWSPVDGLVSGALSFPTIPLRFARS